MSTFTETVLGGENKYIEFKEKYSKSMLKTISAFANYHDGKIILGITDSGDIVGVENPIELRHSIENTINDSIRPRPDFTVEQKIRENKTVLIYNIFKGDQTPYTLDKRTYKRSDTSTVEVNRYDHEGLILEGRNQTYEEQVSSEQKHRFNILGDKMLEALDIESVDENVLKSLELIKKGSYNNAAALFADRNDFIGIGLNLICYKDQDMLIFRDRQKTEQVSLLKQYDAAMLFYRKHINQGDIIEGAYRKSHEEVPEVAYREAVANLLIHRDYRKPGESRIEIFPERIELTSIGGLPFGISEDEYINGKVSIIRNRIITDIFFRLGIIEKIGTGVRRIIKAYGGREQKPEFSVYENSIQVILPRTSVGSSESAMRVKESNLTMEEGRLVHFIKSSKGVSRREVETYMRVKKTKATNLLNGLVTKRLIEKRGTGKETKYVKR